MLITNKIENSHTNISSVEQSNTSPPLSQDISKIIPTVLSKEKVKEKRCLK